MHCQQDITFNNLLAIKTTPLLCLDALNGSQFNIGVEYAWKDKYGVYTEYGRHFRQFNLSENKQQTGFIIRQELRRYVTLVDFKERLFHAIEYSYAQQHYTRTDSMLYRHPGFGADSMYAKTYQVDRTFFGLSYQFGQQWLWRKHILFELFAGAGIRLNTIHCSISDEEAARRQFGDWTVPHNWIQNNGFHVIPKFNVGIRVGYRIK